MKDNDFEILIEHTLNEYGDKYFDEPEVTGHRFSPEFDKKVMAAVKPQKKKGGAKILHIVTAAGAVAAAAVIGIIGFGAMNNMWSDMRSSTSVPYSTAAQNEGAAADSPKSDIKPATPGSDIANEATKEPETDAALTQDTPATNSAKSLNETAENSYGSEKTASGSSCTVTAKSHGQILTLSQEKIDQITRLVQQLISDEELSVNQTFSSDEINRIENEGQFIVIRSENRKIILNGETTPYSVITVFTDGEKGYAVAEGDGKYMCFAISANAEAYKAITSLTEE